MNFAVIFAGGTGQRMNSVALPKQFLKVHGKPIIVHTLEKFEKCEDIDKIIVVCLSDYIDYMFQLKDKYALSKIVEVVPGGATGQESIYNGLCCANTLSVSDKDIVLIHDGVRPLIDVETLSSAIQCVEENGSAITVSKAIETVLVLDGDSVESTVDRSKCYSGRAPQGFYLNEICRAHENAKKLGKSDFIDSAMLMSYFGKELHVIEGPAYNIKVTTPMDFYMFKAMLDAKENEQIKVL